MTSFANCFQPYWRGRPEAHQVASPSPRVRLTPPGDGQLNAKYRYIGVSIVEYIDISIYRRFCSILFLRAGLVWIDNIDVSMYGHKIIDIPIYRYHIGDLYTIISQGTLPFLRSVDGENWRPPWKPWISILTGGRGLKGVPSRDSGLVTSIMSPFSCVVLQNTIRYNSCHGSCMSYLPR